MAYFNNNELQNNLDELGFAEIELFSPEELKKFKLIYQEYFGHMSGEGMYVSHSKTENSLERNLEISNKIISVARNAVNNHFWKFRFHVAHFVVKKANTSSEMSLHQDWNIVDEQSKHNFHLWFPLQNTEQENGGLFILPFSHKFFQNFRSGSFDIPRVPSDDLIEPYIRPVTLKEGQVFAYKTALFHGSYPNTTSSDRVAIIISLVEDDAEVMYYHCEPDLQTSAYKFETIEFFRSLSVLEKGLIPESAIKKSTLPPQTINNKLINSKQLAECYQKYAGEKAFTVK